MAYQSKKKNYKSYFEIFKICFIFVLIYKCNKMKVKYFELQYNGLIYYMCKMRGTDLLRISYVARRGESEEEGAVQRILNKRRISGIASFLLNGGYFPTNIIINVVNEEKVSINNNSQTITFEKEDHLAQVLDGQHRIAGMREAMKESPEIGDIEFPILIVVGLTTSQCAQVFMSINTEQKTVPQSLIYDLYGLVEGSSRDQSILRGNDIARLLNEEDDSPYQDFIKFPGSSKFRGGIQLSSFVNNLKPLVKSEGEFLKYNIENLEPQTKILKNYFKAIAYYYDSKWGDINFNPFLYASGFSAAIDLLINKVLPYCYAQRKFTLDIFKSVLVFTKDSLPKIDEVKGMSGEKQRNLLYERLLNCLNIESVGEHDIEL